MDGPTGIALRGLLALALAMGIGRFAFTPVLPMMQQDAAGLGVAEGGWLAFANYLGYLAGALCAMRIAIRPTFAIRAAMVAIALTTVAMAFTHSFTAWLVLRALPGFASAWVLVFVSAWSLDRLDRAGRADLGGVVFAGVGAGIVFAGFVCLTLANAGYGSAAAWTVLGAAAALLTAGLWNGTGSDSAGAAGSTAVPAPARDTPEFRRLVFCQGAFGLGYIIPATFLPVMAKQIVVDPLLFGWAWPLFGGAAVASTLLVARLARAMTYRGVWALGNLVMAAGVLVPIAVPGLAGIVVAALCVGSTFMVNTMAGMQEARRVAGQNARVLMAAMTSAFAAGQMLGPLLVSALANVEGGFAVALVAAAAPLVLAALLLVQRREPWTASAGS